jgi:GNAT superfamily N-acetyltransferase
MNYQIREAEEGDKQALAELRIAAMKESLENINRFNPVTARNRFLANFAAEKTKKILINGDLAGFYVLQNKNDHYYLDHFYLHPAFQGVGLGSEILRIIQQLAIEDHLPIRLGALRGSRSNAFYLKHGFSYTHEEEWDIYYEFTHG